jgi:hypothetical protein
MGVKGGWVEPMAEGLRPLYVWRQKYSHYRHRCLGSSQEVMSADPGGTERVQTGALVCERRWCVCTAAGCILILTFLHIRIATDQAEVKTVSEYSVVSRAGVIIGRTLTLTLSFPGYTFFAPRLFLRDEVGIDD